MEEKTLLKGQGQTDNSNRRRMVCKSYENKNNTNLFVIAEP